MTAKRQVLIECDHLSCTSIYTWTKPFDHNQEDQRRAQQKRLIDRTREKARFAGWGRSGGRDYCPRHLASHREANRLERGES